MVPVDDLRRWETIPVSVPLPANEEEWLDEEDKDAAATAFGAFVFPFTGTANAEGMLLPELPPTPDMFIMDEMSIADPKMAAEGAAAAPVPAKGEFG